MHASQHFNRVRLAVPATRDLVCEQSRADRMPAAKDAAEAEQQEEGAGIPAANEKIEKQRKEWALLIFSSHLCVDLVCVGEREERKRRGRGEKEKTKRRQRERELSLSQEKKAQKFSPPPAGETPDPG